jgi:tripartite-type tricarboxylate transporter receptor subunit TctC
VPTTAEAGPPRVLSAINFMLFAPAAAPSDVIVSLNAACLAVMEEPTLREQLTRAGFEVMTSTPDEAMGILRAERDRWAPILAGLNLNLD